jgi:hypothetical protein
MGEENWHISKGKYVTPSVNILQFLDEIEKVCKKYNISISHEDGHGAFILEEYDEFNFRWLRKSQIDCE